MHSPFIGSPTEVIEWEPITEIFAKQVKEKGKYLAIVVANENEIIQQITYEELNKEASRLAEYFVKKNICRGQLVTLLVNDKMNDGMLNLIKAILALWKIGAAYTPIGLSEKEEDIKGKIDNSDANVFFIDLDEATPSTSEKITILLNIDHETITRKNLMSQNEFEKTPSLLPSITLSPDDLAYVMYTSGSTQGPRKGAATLHKGIPYPLKAHQDALLLSAKDHLTQMAVVGFDASLMETLMALGTGATLFIVPLEIRKNPTRLQQFFEKYKITQTIITPSELKNLKPQNFESLKGLIVMGESFDKTLIDPWIKVGKTVVNGYGLTEATICTTLGKCELDKALTIGKPIIGTKLYVLDANYLPVEFYNIGEIYIGGPGVAQGYWKNDTLTRERFINIKDPDTQQNIIVYKTGDLGRCLENGEWIVAGRADNQIKIRGQRLEPEYIESVLKQYTEENTLIIKDACVVGIKEGQNQLLVAYIELFDSTPQNEIELRGKIRIYLSEKLTSFMMPNAMVFSTLPVAERGKVDRNALKEKGITRNYSETGECPKTEAEKTMENIWLTVLGHEQDTALFRDSDFFSLGGNSLNIISLLNAIQKNPEVFPEAKTLTEAAITQCRTLKDMALIAKRASLKKMNNKETPESIYYVHSLLGNGESECQMFMSDFPYTAYSYKALGLINAEYLEENLIALAQNYVNELLLTKNLMLQTFEKPVVLVGWSAGGIISLEMARQLKEKGYTNISVIMLDTEMIHITTTQKIIELGNFLNTLLFRENGSLFNENNFEGLDLSNVIHEVFSVLEKKAENKPEILLKLKFVKCLFKSQQNYLKTPEFKNAIQHEKIILIAAEDTLKKNNCLGWSKNVPCKEILETNHYDIIKNKKCIQALIQNINYIYEATHFKDLSEKIKNKYQKPIEKKHLLSDKIWRLSRETYIPVNLSYDHPAETSSDNALSSPRIKNINFEELFALSGKTKILIQGQAGTGKTLLMQFFAQQWSCQQLWQNASWELVLLLPLKKLPGWTKKTKNYQLSLSEIVYYEYFGEAVDVQKLNLLHSFLNSKKDKILWLLDGFDEISEKLEEPSSLLKEVMGELLNQKNILITDRLGYRQKIQEFFVVNNEGLNVNGIAKYLQTHLSAEMQKNIENFIKDKKLLSTPIILEIVCTLAGQSGNLEKNVSLVNIYKEMCNKLRAYEWRKNPVSESTRLPISFDHIKRAAYKCLKLFAFQKHARDYIQTGKGNTDLIAIEDICKKIALEENQELEKAALLLPSLKKTLPLLKLDEKHLLHFVIKSGFFHEVKKYDGTTILNLEFIHLSFQEFLAASYISKLGIDEIEIKLDKHASSKECESMFVFLSTLLAKSKKINDYFKWFTQERSDLKEKGEDRKTKRRLDFTKRKDRQIAFLLMQSWNICQSENSNNIEASNIEDIKNICNQYYFWLINFKGCDSVICDMSDNEKNMILQILKREGISHGASPFLKNIKNDGTFREEENQEGRNFLDGYSKEKAIESNKENNHIAESLILDFSNKDNDLSVRLTAAEGLIELEESSNKVIKFLIRMLSEKISDLLIKQRASKALITLAEKNDSVVPALILHFCENHFDPFHTQVVTGCIIKLNQEINETEGKTIQVLMKIITDPQCINLKLESSAIQILGILNQLKAAADEIIVNLVNALFVSIYSEADIIKILTKLCKVNDTAIECIEGMLADENTDMLTKKMCLTVWIDSRKKNGKNIPDLITIIADLNIPLWIRKDAAKALATYAEKNDRVVPALILHFCSNDLDQSVTQDVTESIIRLDREISETEGKIIRVLIKIINGIGCVNLDVTSSAIQILGILAQLGQLGEATNEVIRSLVNTLSYSDSYSYRHSMKALVKLCEVNDKAVENLIEIVSDKNTDLSIKQRCLEVLISSGKKNGRIIPALIKMLADLRLAPWIRQKSANALGKLGQSDPRYLHEMIRALIENIADKDLKIQQSTEAALTKLNDTHGLINMIILIYWIINSLHREELKAPEEAIWEKQIKEEKWVPHKNNNANVNILRANDSSINLFFQQRMGNFIGSLIQKNKKISQDFNLLKIEGLIHLDLSNMFKDEHPLLVAISFYIGRNPKDIYKIAVDYLKDNWTELGKDTSSLCGRNKNSCLESFKNNELDSYTVIEILMHIMKRPIIVIGTDGKVKNQPMIKSGLQGEPIFVHHHEGAQYKAFLLASQSKGSEILTRILKGDNSNYEPAKVKGKENKPYNQGFFKSPPLKPPQLNRRLTQKSSDQTGISNVTHVHYPDPKTIESISAGIDKPVFAFNQDTRRNQMS